MALRKPKLKIDLTDKLLKLRATHETKLIKYWRSLYPEFNNVSISVKHEAVKFYSVDIFTVRIDGHLVLRRFIADPFDTHKWRYELYDLEENKI